MADEQYYNDANQGSNHIECSENESENEGHDGTK